MLVLAVVVIYQLPTVVVLVARLPLRHRPGYLISNLLKATTLPISTPSAQIAVMERQALIPTRQTFLVIPQQFPVKARSLLAAWVVIVMA